ncbi:MAG: ATP-grasp domain-containing protein [Aureispira sp.]
MQAYIQTNTQGDYFNINAYVAADGFQQLGWEVVKFHSIEEVEGADSSVVLVGGIGMVRKRLEQLGIKQDYEIEYPEELRLFLKRKVWQSTLQKIIQQEQRNVFIKPVQTKLFKGKVIRRFGDFIGLKYEEEVPVWCSEVVELVTEWRCFVRYGELLDVRRYTGRWDSRIDIRIIEAAIEAYTSQPAAYGLDFGVDAQGEHYLVEVNDGHSLGTYGTWPISYAKFISARWAELTKTEDLLNF